MVQLGWCKFSLTLVQPFLCNELICRENHALRDTQTAKPCVSGTAVVFPMLANQASLEYSLNWIDKSKVHICPYKYINFPMKNWGIERIMTIYTSAQIRRFSVAALHHARVFNVSIISSCGNTFPRNPGIIIFIILIICVQNQKFVGLLWAVSHPDENGISCELSWFSLLVTRAHKQRNILSHHTKTTAPLPLQIHTSLPMAFLWVSVFFNWRKKLYFWLR